MTGTLSKKIEETTILSPKSESFDKKSIGDEVVFSNTRPGTGIGIRSERARNTSDVFGNLRSWSCRLRKPWHSQDKNLTPLTQKKLAGILAKL